MLNMDAADAMSMQAEGVIPSVYIYYLKFQAFSSPYEPPSNQPGGLRSVADHGLHEESSLPRHPSTSPPQLLTHKWQTICLACR